MHAVAESMAAHHKDFRREDFLDHNELASMLHIAPRTLSRYRERGLLPFLQLSPKKVIYYKADAEQFMRSRYNTQIFKTESNGQGLLFA